MTMSSNADEWKSSVSFCCVGGDSSSQDGYHAAVAAVATTDIGDGNISTEAELNNPPYGGRLLGPVVGTTTCKTMRRRRSRYQSSANEIGRLIIAVTVAGSILGALCIIVLQHQQSPPSIVSNAGVGTTTTMTGTSSSFAQSVEESSRGSRRKLASFAGENVDGNELLATLERRAGERRKRTHPPPTQRLPENSAALKGGTCFQMPGYDLSSTGDQNDDGGGASGPSNHLCGKHALNASVRHPHLYPDEHALTSKSRVVIVGIFSNAMGVDLALALHSQCGVDDIVGIDAVLPNTSKHRVHVIDQHLAMLQKHVPGFELVDLPFVGVQPRRIVDSYEDDDSSWAEGLTAEDKEEFDIVKTYNPTHVVHLGSYREDGDVGSLANIRGLSPYGDNVPFFQLRQGMVSMDQLLKSLADNSKSSSDDEGERQPHFTYASSDSVYGGASEAGGTDRRRLASKKTPKKTSTTKEKKQNSPPFKAETTLLHEGLTLTPSTDGTSLYGATKLMDEVLAATYAHHHKVHSVGLRFSSVYGPHTLPGAVLYEMARLAVRGDDGASLILKKGSKEDVAAGQERDLLYVDDAVDALIAAMQFRNSSAAAAGESLHPTYINVGTGRKTTMKKVAKIMNTVAFPPSEDDQKVIDDDEDGSTTAAAAMSIDRSMDLLGWQPSTSLKNGMTKVISWHSAKAFPYGDVPEKHRPSTAVVGQRGEDDSQRIPCVSECANPNHCAASALDEVVDTVRNVTSTCQYVMYTVNFHPELDYMHSSDSTKVQSVERKVCKVAFVTRSTPVVLEAITSHLKTEKPSTNDVKEAYAQKNGQLKYKTWTLIWVNEPRSMEDMMLLKMAPGSFFNASVTKAIYVSPTKSGLPPTKDILRIVKSADFPGRAPGKRWVGVTPYRRKIIQPAQPTRRTILFVPEPVVSEGTIDKSTVVTSVNYLLSMLDVHDEEPPALRAQRHFYNSAWSTLKREEFRSIHDPKWKDGFRWVYTQWIIHDFNLEESRRLRCDWYGEYVFWHRESQPEFTSEDMSLHYVLARRASEDKLSDKCEQWLSVLDPKVLKSPKEEHWYINFRKNVKCKAFGNHKKDKRGVLLFVRTVDKDVTSTVKTKLRETRKHEREKNHYEEEGGDGKENRDDETDDEGTEVDPKAAAAAEGEIMKEIDDVESEGREEALDQGGEEDEEDEEGEEDDEQQEKEGEEEA